MLENQIWQESSLGAGDSKSFIWYMGPRERAPKGQNHANFKVISSDPEVEQSSYVVFKYLLICEELKLFMAVPRVAPMGPGGGGGV